MTDWPYPFWIAHRGAGKLAPENTLAAFRVGASHGYRAFECDVKLSADGVPFLLHDSTLQRTTPESGVAGERPWSALSCLDAGAWHSRQFAGEPMPTLAGVGAYVQRNGFALNIELKPTPGQEAETGRVVADFVTANWRGDSIPPLLSSFQPAALEAAKRAQPQWPRALLLDELRAGWLDEAEALGCVAVVAAYRLLDAAVIASLHARGMRSLAYTVNDAVEARRLHGAGIDGLITDEVAKFSAVAAAVRDDRGQAAVPCDGFGSTLTLRITGSRQASAAIDKATTPAKQSE